jgi:hypothetical protein
MTVKDVKPLPARHALSIAVLCIESVMDGDFDRELAGALITVRTLRDAQPHEPVVWGQGGRRRKSRCEEPAALAEEEGQMALVLEIGA